MKKQAIIVIGYFIVAIAFFLAGRFSSQSIGEERAVFSNRQPENKGLRLEELRVSPVTSVPNKDLGSGQIAQDPSPSIGPVDALVVVQEVSDFQCPVCNRAFFPLKQLAGDFPNQVRLVFKHHPLEMHRNALNAACASMAAHRQGKFWEYATILFENQSALDENSLMQYASRLGLDPHKFAQDYNDVALRARVKSEGDSAMELGATGTPSFFINGRKEVGWASYEAIKQYVAQEIEAMKALLAQGKSVKDARIERVRANLREAQSFLNSALGLEFR